MGGAESVVSTVMKYIDAVSCTPDTYQVETCLISFEKPFDVLKIGVAVFPGKSDHVRHLRTK